MAIKGVEITVQYTAWDTASNVGKTGDSANHTLRVVKDGTASAATNSPSEVDATNCPGLYKLTLTSAEMTANAVTLCGKSSTADIVLIPLHIITEQGNFATLTDRLTAARAGYLDKLNVSGALAHSDAAATYKANVAPLAQETTLTAMKGVGWTNETLTAIALAIVNLHDIEASDVKAALEADGSKLDHLWETTEDNGGTRRFTEAALAEAPSGTGGDATAANQETIIAAIGELVPGSPVNLDISGSPITMGDS